MRKQHKKTYLLVPLVLALILFFTFELVSLNAFGQAPNSSFHPASDGPSIADARSPGAGHTTTAGVSQTPTLPSGVASVVAQLNKPNTSSGAQPTIPPQGKAIIINRADNVQELYAYENGKLVFSTPVTTGSLYLQTFLGTFHVTNKMRDVNLYSPWPKGSPNYYSPEHANYALDYDGPIYIHDATWRSVFGPGTDRRHYDPVFGWMDGSHGCVNTPLSAAEWLYNWAPVGTLVEVVD